MSHHRYSCLSRHIDLPGTARARMRKSRSAARATAIICALATTACGGGGGGLGSSIAAGSPVMAGSSNPPSTGSSGTGSTGNGSTSDNGDSSTATVAPGAIAPAVTALGGPSFDGSSGSLTTNTSFSGSATTVQFTSSSISVSPNQAATVIIFDNFGSGTTSDQGRHSYQIIIPSVNLNVTGFNMGNVGSFFWDFPGDIPLAGLSYVALGTWRQPSAGAGTNTTDTYFVFGYDTPAVMMPTTGTATFSGQTGFNLYQQSGGQVLSSFGAGKANFSVDFASGNVTGAFTQQWAGGPWNDVSVNASIAAGTSKFSGTTGVTSAPVGPFTLKASATGHIDGGFYGPAAQNIGALWSLTDGTTTAVGGVAAGH